MVLLDWDGSGHVRPRLGSGIYDFLLDNLKPNDQEKLFYHFSRPQLMLGVKKIDGAGKVV